MTMRMTASLADASSHPLTGNITHTIMPDYLDFNITHRHLLHFSFNYTIFASVSMKQFAVSPLLLLLFALTIPPRLLDIFTTPFLLFSSASFLPHFYIIISELVNSGWPWKGGITLEGVHMLLSASHCF